MKYLRRALGTGIVLAFLLAGGCSEQVPKQVSRLFPSLVEATRTPFQPVAPTPTKTLAPTLTPVPVRELNVWADPAMPQALREQIFRKGRLPEEVRTVKTAESANLQIGALRGEPAATWVYALVAPFPTLVDEVSLEEIQRAWRGDAGETFSGLLMMAETTRAALEARWGAPGGSRLQILAADRLLEEAWANRSANGAARLAIIPFEEIQPRWKVLRVDGMSVFDKNLNIEKYPLTVWFGITGSAEALNLLREKLGEGVDLIPASTNRDPGKMTVLVMTGVTALGRATAYKMDTNGTTYPGRDIQEWLRSADLTHISNEVSFNRDCPGGSFTSTSTMFCSKPEYIELLDYVGTDIVELSGNHNNDWGRDASTYSLGLYRERGWTVFAGGADLDEARQPAKIQNNGNKLAFIGCNPAGPAGAWATADQPGAAPCDDYGWMLDAIRQARAEGYLPVVTFQYFELYIYRPSDHQERNFRAAADAGAVIVSGSQAHFPQIMEFHNDTFIHYGLGNLFFDQMDIPVPGTRKEFIDRHVFYDGKYLGVELLTAMLEDYARPRPMTEDERNAMLGDIFSAAGW
jgi:poly-gamma-glutamate synthesis protein (capsule biosynthesis protein)